MTKNTCLNTKNWGNNLFEQGTFVFELLNKSFEQFDQFELEQNGLSPILVLRNACEKTENNLNYVRLSYQVQHISR